MSAYQRDRAVSRVPPGVEMKVLRLSTGTGDGMLVFGKAEDWMERGYTQTREYLRATATATSEEADRDAAAFSGIEATAPVEALD
jgi:hypothetical protein